MDSRKPERHRVVSLMNRSLSGFIYEICSSYPRKRHFSIKNGIEWHPTIFVDAISCQQKGSSLPFPLVSKRFDSFHHFLDHFSLMFGRSRWRPKRRSSLWSANGNLPPRNRAWVDFIFVLLCFSLSLNQWKSYVGKQKSHRQKGRIVVAIVDQSCCFFFLGWREQKKREVNLFFFVANTIVRLSLGAGEPIKTALWKQATSGRPVSKFNHGPSFTDFFFVLPGSYLVFSCSHWTFYRVLPSFSLTLFLFYR